MPGGSVRQLGLFIHFGSMSTGPLDKQIQICVSQSDIIAVLSRSPCVTSSEPASSVHANGIEEERFFRVDGSAAR